jgi:Cu/Ag efflux protein CusF
MDMRTAVFGAILAMCAAVVPMHAQAPAAPRYVSIIGTIEKVDTTAKSLALKTDKGEESAIKFDDRTQFLMLPAGEKDTKKATRAAAADVSAGDRVIARMRADDKTGLPAVFVYFEKQSDIAQLHKKTDEEWQTQSVHGTVKSVDAAAKRIVISARGGFGPPKEVILDASGSVEFERFSLTSGKYEPSSAGLTPIQTGDQVRLIGQKNADQTEIKLEAIQSATFKSLPVTVKSVDTATGTIAATDLVSKKPITINVKPDTQLKRLDDATALLMARRLNPTFQNETGRGGRGGRGQGANPSTTGQAPATGGSTTGVSAFAGRGGQGGGGRGGRNADPDKLLDQQPTIELADLKAGEPVVVTGGPSSDMTTLTATSVVAGVDPILRAAPDRGADPLAGNWNFGELGGGGQE